MKDTGFVWVGDQIILEGTTGGYGEPVYVFGETIKKNIICIKLVNRDFANLSNVFVKLEDDQNQAFKEKEQLINF